MASLRALLGVLLCSLMVSASEILPQADFDLQSKWCLAGVCSNFKWFVCRKANMKSGIAMVEPTEDGVLSVTRSDTYRKQFNHHVTGFVTEMRVVNGKPDKYGLNHYINTGWNETFTGILPENIVHLPKTGTFTLVLKFYIKIA
uniref:Lipocalin/cytosolic fatty-acid binding domain-containing protein n=1 Tax=Oreochromis niloticus TaxID=8128 RepID=A0A669DQD8_ORENI